MLILCIDYECLYYCGVKNNCIISHQLNNNRGEAFKYCFIIFRSDSSTENFGTIPRRWMGLRKNQEHSFPKLTKEASTSMEDIHIIGHISNAPGTVVRPKSMCVPEIGYYRDMHGVGGCDERIFSENNVHRQISTRGSFLNNANRQVFGGAIDTGVPRTDTCNDVVSAI